jgi:hypothetical protein
MQPLVLQKQRQGYAESIYILQEQHYYAYC